MKDKTFADSVKKLLTEVLQDRDDAVEWIGKLRLALDAAVTDRPEVAQDISEFLPPDWWDKTGELIDPPQLEDSGP